MTAKYSEEQKREVLSLILSGSTVTEASRKANIPRTTVSTWWQSRLDPKLKLAEVANSAPTESQIHLRVKLLEDKYRALETKLNTLDQYVQANQAVFLWATSQIRSQAKLKSQELSEISTTKRWVPPKNSS